MAITRKPPAKCADTRRPTAMPATRRRRGEVDRSSRRCQAWGQVDDGHTGETMPVVAANGELSTGRTRAEKENRHIQSGSQRDHLVAIWRDGDAESSDQ